MDKIIIQIIDMLHEDFMPLVPTQGVIFICVLPLIWNVCFGEMIS